jgi:predicted secreted protein
MATGALNGTDLVLKIYKLPLGYIDVAYATNFQLTFEADEVNITHKDSGGWKDIFLGTKKWAIEIEALYQNESNPFNNYFIDIFDKFDNSNFMQIEFSVNNANAGDDNLKYRSRARVVKLEQSGEFENQAVYKALLTGQGVITQSGY